MKKIAGILWDNDGVLVDTERYFFETNRDFFREHDIELTEHDFLRWFLADNCGAWHLLMERGASTEEIAQYRAQRNHRHTQRLTEQDITAIDGVADALASLSLHLPMGVVTSASAEHFSAIHDRLGLLQYFRFVLTEESYVNSKPSPEPYLLGLTRLGLTAEKCVVVEDSPRGLQAARAAGMRCLILRNSLTRYHDFAGAYHVADDIRELYQVLVSLS
jgi:HAD superfamily hydrolase (TIGR01509 family)